MSWSERKKYYLKIDEYRKWYSRIVWINDIPDFEELYFEVDINQPDRIVGFNESIKRLVNFALSGKDRVRKIKFVALVIKSLEMQDYLNNTNLKIYNEIMKYIPEAESGVDQRDISNILGINYKSFRRWCRLSFQGALS